MYKLAQFDTINTIINFDRGIGLEGNNNGGTGPTGPSMGPIGPAGDTGSTGPTGIQGRPGIGFAGSTGPTGAAGTAVNTGSTGPTGSASVVTGPTGSATGYTGPTGSASTVTGYTGPTGSESTVTGYTGPTGSASTVTGYTGPTGSASNVTGYTGPTGSATGYTGPTGSASTVTGYTGPTGSATGYTGPTGSASTVTGYTGPTGSASTVTGYTGPTGSASTVTGYTGPTGSASTVTGYTGPTGSATGYTGPTGSASVVTGPTGVTGPAGPTGSQGVVTFKTDMSGLTPSTPSTGDITLSGILGVANGGSGVTTSSGASSIVLRDANQNILANNISLSTQTTVSSATPIVLTVASAPYQTITGTSPQVVTLPNATTLSVGTIYYFNNNTTQITNINNQGGTTLYNALAGSNCELILLTNSTSNGTWDAHSFLPSGAQFGSNGLSYSGNLSLTGSGTNTIAQVGSGTLQIGAFKSTGIINLNSNDVINGAGIQASIFQGALQGNADTATLATASTNIAGGVIGNIPYQSGTGSTSLLTNGSAGTVLTSGGVGGIPTWTTPASSTITVTDTNTAGTYYPTFVSGTGANQILRADATTTPFTYNPNTGVLTATNFSGSLNGNANTATTSTNIAGGVIGNVPYQTGAGATALLTNGLTGTVLTSGGVGAIPTWSAPSGATTVNVTDTNTNATYYPTFVSAAGTNQILYTDIATSALLYNPNTATLQSENITVTNTLRPSRINDVLASGGTSGQVLTCGTGNSVVWGSAGAYNALYGYGWDGAVNLDGSGASKAYSFVTTDAGITTYTLTRDVFATTFTVGASITVLTASFRIFATTSISLGSGAVMSNSGGNASGTTAGTATSAGYFKGSGAGASGLLAASAGAVGTAPTVPTAATWVGMLGGRGASARATSTTFIGTSPMTVANYNLSVPANADAGRFILNNINFWNQRSLATASALWQPTPSMGGSSGSKSTTGTTASSGAGGGGGGFMFLVSPSITGDSNSIRAVGGAGGNAGGTGGNFGGGGGGGGGIIGVVTTASSYNSALFNVSGGAGGTSVWLGGAATICPVGETNGTNTSTTTNPLTVFPTSCLSRATIYVISLHITGGVGTVASAVSISGAGCSWSLITNVPFSPASPLNTRRLQVWVGSSSGGSISYSDDPRALIYFDVSPTTVRYTYDGIQGTQYADGNNPLDQYTSNTGTATATITSTLTNVPLTTNLQYSIVARTGGTAPVAGTGNTLLTQGATAPISNSMVATGRQTNTQTWTTNADSAIVTLDFSASGGGETGIAGESGKIVPFLL
jgi:collagen type VII alpha